MEVFLHSSTSSTDFMENLINCTILGKSTGFSRALIFIIFIRSDEKYILLEINFRVFPFQFLFLFLSAPPITCFFINFNNNDNSSSINNKVHLVWLKSTELFHLWTILDFFITLILFFKKNKKFRGFLKNQQLYR